MITLFVSSDELAALIGCQPTSRACMRRWLKKHEWPFEEDRNRFPKVLRSYYEQRMMGTSPKLPKTGANEPNYSCFEAA